MKYEQFALGTCVKVAGGYAFKSNDLSDEGIPIVRISDLRNGELVLDKVARIPESKVGKGRSYQIEPGDILMAMSGATTGKIGLAPNDLTGVVLQNQRVGNFKTTDNSKIVKCYLRHYLTSPNYLSQVWNTVVGVAQPNISSKQLESFKIPLPPLSEQKRIAEILDRAEALRAKRRVALALLDELTQSIFLDMFGDPVSNPKGWEWGKLKDVLVLITYGLTVRPKYVPDGIPLISGKEIRSGIVDYENAAKISQKDFDALSQKAKPTKHDLLFSKTGSIGHTAIIESDLPFALAQNVARLTFAPTLVNHTYALFYLRSRSIQSLAKRSVRGNAVKDLQLGVMGDFPFALPPLQLQLEFAQRIDALQILRKVCEKANFNCDQLFTSLQHRAFRGQLSSRCLE